MQNEAIHFATLGRWDQFSAGPTAPKAGPILPIELAEADKAVKLITPDNKEKS